MRRLVERARRGEGPAFLECKTYRYYGHHVGDVNREYYRPKQEEQEWMTQRDPLRRCRRWLIAQGLADAGGARCGSSADVEGRDRRGRRVRAGRALSREPSKVDEDVYA